MRKLALIALLLMSAGAVYAQDAEESPAQCVRRLGHEVDCFIKEADARSLLCGLSMKLYLLNGDRERASTCIANARKALAAYYPPALKRFGKNAAGASQLKDTYAFVLSSLEALWPADGELKRDYDRRQQEREARVNERLERLKLEK